MSVSLQLKRNFGFRWKHSRIFFFPYNGLYWEPNGSRSKREFQCSFKGL